MVADMYATKYFSTAGKARTFAVVLKRVASDTRDIFHVWLGWLGGWFWSVWGGWNLIVHTNSRH